MELSRLGPRELRRFREALERGEPVHLRLEGPLPRGIRLDELAPLCASATAADPHTQAALDAFRAPPARPGRAERVTAVIPTNRGAPAGLRALREQDMEVRVLLVSNGEGPERVNGADVVRVPWEGHGATRQHAVERWVEDEYVLMTVDDAIPLGRGFVRSLVEALEVGPWDAVVARQIPWPDADPVTRKAVRDWTPAGQKVCAAPQVDNVCTLYRTATLRAHPLPDVEIAEDLWWSRGKRVGYAPLSPVLHSHARSAGHLWSRTVAIHAERVKAGDEPTVRSIAGVVAALPGVVKPMLDAGPAEGANQVAELVGQWWGGRRGRRAKRRSEREARKEARQGARRRSEESS